MFTEPLSDNELFAFAGLWEEWKSPEGERIQTCTIITTEASELVADFHHRMPVILRQQDDPLWIDPATLMAELFDPLLTSKNVTFLIADRR